MPAYNSSFYLANTVYLACLKWECRITNMEMSYVLLVVSQIHFYFMCIGMYLHVCMIQDAYLITSVRSYGTVVTDSFELPCGCGK